MMQQTVDNLTSAYEKTTAPLKEQQQILVAEIARLNSEITAKDARIQQLAPLATEKQDLLKQSSDLREEVQALKEAKEAKGNNEELLLNKLKDAEDYIAELQEDASNAAEVFKNL